MWSSRNEFFGIHTYCSETVGHLPPVRGFFPLSSSRNYSFILVIINPPTLCLCVLGGSHRDFNATPPDESGGQDHQKWNPNRSEKAEATAEAIAQTDVSDRLGTCAVPLAVRMRTRRREHATAGKGRFHVGPAGRHEAEPERSPGRRPPLVRWTGGPFDATGNCWAATTRWARTTWAERTRLGTAKRVGREPPARVECPDARGGTSPSDDDSAVARNVRAPCERGTPELIESHRATSLGNFGLLLVPYLYEVSNEALHEDEDGSNDELLYASLKRQAKARTFGGLSLLRLLLWAFRFDERTMSLTRRRSVASDRPDTLDIPGRAPPCQRMASCSCETMLLVEGRPTGTEPGRRRSVKAEAFLRDGLKEEDHLWVNVVIISQTTSRRRPNDSAANHP
ncbi:hypothetical protein BHM03_00030566 [Ensete ventricosum]|nr:hypothetical protein BHM03_00030566 [Ensete ventricosum]